MYLFCVYLYIALIFNALYNQLFCIFQAYFLPLQRLFYVYYASKEQRTNRTDQSGRTGKRYDAERYCPVLGAVSSIVPQPNIKARFKKYVFAHLRGSGRSSGRPEAAPLRSGYSGVVRHCGRPPWNYPRKGRNNKTTSGGNRKTSIPVAILKKNINERALRSRP